MYNFHFILVNTVAKRWKVLREKFAIAHRKYFNDEIQPTYVHYEKCEFLAPYVNLHVDRKKKDCVEDHFESDNEQSTAQSRFDDSNLANLVRLHPIIYDRNHIDFKKVSKRNNAWKDISKETGWNSQQIQKRWRVMRDRFVRELRKSKSFSNETFACTHFFNDMLFLAPHVKSNNYKIETELGNVVKSEGLVLSEVREIMNFDEQIGSQEIIEETTEIENPSEEYQNYCLVEDQSYVESQQENQDDYQEQDSIPENEQEYEFVKDENPDDNDEVVVINDEVFEDDGECFVEEIEEKEMSNLTESRKRKSTSTSDQYEKPNKFMRTETSQSPPKSHESFSNVNLHNYSEALTDEDMAFGQTIGLMLKKIPNRLKTAVKLKIFQSLDEFELLHNLK